jgi:nucleoside-diphosphate-sugar epimerase
VVVHSAARTQWNLPTEQAWAANVGSIAPLAEVIGPDTHLVHVSTRYALGLRGDVESTDISDYRNTYEWSKAAAERVARSLFGPCTVVRPPLVIGRRSDGAIARFNGLYTIVQAIVTGMLPVLVGMRESPQDIVTSCDVSRCVLQAAETGRPDRTRVEILGRGNGAMSSGDVLATMMLGVNRWRARHGHEPVAAPDFVPEERWDRFYLPFARPHLTGHQLRSIDLLREFTPYMSIADVAAVTWRSEPLDRAIATATEWWAGARPGLARRHPKPWIGRADD